MSNEWYVTEEGLRHSKDGALSTIDHWLLSFVDEYSPAPNKDVLSYFAEFYDLRYSEVRVAMNNLQRLGYLKQE